MADLSTNRGLMSQLNTSNNDIQLTQSNIMNNQQMENQNNISANQQNEMSQPYQPPQQQELSYKDNQNSRQIHAFEDEIHYDDSSFSCYMKTVNCLGRCLGSLRAWIPCCCCCCPYPYRIVRQFEVGILERFGQFRKFLQPGMHKINPFTENVKKVNKRTYIVEVGKQSILTRDNLTIWIDAVVYYRIVEPKKALYRLKDVASCVVEITTASLRTICGECKLQQILEEREKVSEEISSYLFQHIKDWGILIEQVFIKDMVMNQTLQYAMSSAAKMRRVGESKVISAKADVQSATLYREAADMLDSNAAMQIRYLDTVSQLAVTPNQKIVFIPLNKDEFQEENNILDVDKKAQQVYTQQEYEKAMEYYQKQQQQNMQEPSYNLLMQKPKTKGILKNKSQEEEEEPLQIQQQQQENNNQ